MAKPRVFVSSTYYDLKYVRERLEHFIRVYNMEPILFEYDKVYYNPSLSASSSCYKEIEGCHLMILIIGGRYGSIDTQKERDNYNNEFVSITQNEYQTAIKKGIPTMVFIDRNVLTEYRTYQNNKTSISNEFKFAYVDDIKIFEFINKVVKGVVKDFTKVEDIEHYLANQISGMLYDYLISLQYNKEDNEIKNAVDEIKTVSSSMQNTINSIAEKILSNQKYQDALYEQKKSLIDFFLELLKQNIDFGIFDFNIPEDKLIELKKIFISTIFNVSKINEIQEIEDFKLQLEAEEELCHLCEFQLNEAYSGANVKIKFYQFRKQLYKIINDISTDTNLYDYFNSRLINTIREIIEPF